MIEVTLEGDDYVITCPQCNVPTMVRKSEINCLIFRHAVFRSNLKPIDPHSSKKICDDLIANKKIYGCGKPFQLIWNDSKLYSIKCDYI
jgi:hypothetical protein